MPSLISLISLALVLVNMVMVVVIDVHPFEDIIENSMERIMHVFPELECGLPKLLLESLNSFSPPLHATRVQPNGDERLTDRGEEAAGMC